MQAKRCLILAAGFGTRMGPIGKRLPKVMWPVFGMSLLELQVHFARQLGYQEIFINLHHQADEILARANKSRSFDHVTWLIERPAILDIGGGIHNLAQRVNYQGELLVLNADQFLWFTAADLERWRHTLDPWDGILLAWQVPSEKGYNQLACDAQGRFLKVVPNAEVPRGVMMNTYSGNALIKLASLPPRSGPSAFFASVSTPERMIKTAQLAQGRYWDFGTAERYYRSMTGILAHDQSAAPDPFIQFLYNVGALKADKIHRASHSYGCSVPGLIHLGDGTPSGHHAPGIILEGESHEVQGSGPVVVFQGEVQPLS